MSGIRHTVRVVPQDLDVKPAATIHEDLDWFVGSAPPVEDDSDASQAWLDALPVEPA
jgi:hypothetical protein